MTGELCPHCFAPPRADGRPGCTCATRIGDPSDTAATALLPGISGPHPTDAASLTDTAILPTDRSALAAEAATSSGPNPDDLRLFDDVPPAAGAAAGPAAAAGDARPAAGGTATGGLT
ncbi:hypothetical protein AAHZ94_26215, partial [Streptomyces sp. HSW2009]